MVKTTNPFLIHKNMSRFGNYQQIIEDEKIKEIISFGSKVKQEKNIFKKIKLNIQFNKLIRDYAKHNR